ncbi:claudin-10-like isoform X3 [Anabas testudineus]|uniref:Claudin n=1 Tax=Anabas testudineus TaxID=64144 RepID=A0A3Q1HSH6_ANATE|nr:claudin-10-like isoform X3 [Anabas testudineus]
MKYRTMVMYMEIGCFVSCLCGWILVCSTLPTPFWSYSENSGSVMTTADFFSNLWQDCVSDNTGASSCKGFPSLMALSGFLHVCRALTICAVITGFFGGVLTLIGMKCTKIGGSEIANARVTFAGGLTYMVSGFCGMITYSWWANKTRTEFVDPLFMDAKRELGAAIFIGWGGSILLILGGAVQTYFSGKEGLPSGSQKEHRRPGSYAWTRQTYMLPAAASRMSLGSPLLYEGRQSRTTRATTKTGRTYSRDNFV